MYGRARPVLSPFLKPLPPVLCRGLVSGLELLSWEPPCATRWTTGRLFSQGRREEDYLVQAEDHLPVSPSHILSLVRKGLLDADGVGVRCINQSRETFVCFLPGGRGLSTPWLPAPQCQPVVSSELLLPLSSPVDGGVRVGEAMGSGFIM